MSYPGVTNAFATNAADAHRRHGPRPSFAPQTMPERLGSHRKLQLVEQGMTSETLRFAG